MKITDQIFFVTGAASGLGRAAAHRLHALGARVALLDLAAVPAEQLEEYGAGRAVGCQCDVRSEEDVLAAIAEVDGKWPGGEVGGLVMAAGVGMAGKTVGNDGDPFDLETFKATIDINLVGSFNVARLVAARMVRQHPQPKAGTKEVVQDDRGVIILTSSVSATEGQMGQVAYGSSKAGVEGLTLPMARDLARHGIRVVTIAPSLFSTAMGANTSDKVRANLEKSLLFPPRFGKADEYAQLAVAVIENPMLNGSVIRLDGGSRMSKM